MKTFINPIPIIIISALIFFKCQYSPTDDPNADKSVGFELIEEIDYSRVVTGGVSPVQVHPRPIRIYLWYPARKSKEEKPMCFGDYVTYADEDIWPEKIVGKLREELKFINRPLARSLEPARFDSLLQQPVNAIEKAVPLEGPFPLIVIGQGLYYESPIAFAALAEYLAGQGFVVATCPLVGKNSPIVRCDLLDLETQVRDLEFVITQVCRYAFVSPDKLGVFGFDMGGMAGLILSMRNADVDAFVSVSSGILYPHPSGIPMSSPDYDPLALRIPWLHSIPTTWLPHGPDSLAGSLFENAIHSDRYLLLTEGLGHVDYTSYALIEGRSAMRNYWVTANPKVIKSHEAVCEYICNFYNAFLTPDPESLMMFSKDPEDLFPDLSWSLKHRPATSASITYEEFVQAILAGQADKVIDELRALQESHPDHILLNNTYLMRLVWSLRDTWDLTEKLMPVIKFRAELYPSSDDAQWMLAEGYIDVGDYPEASEVYRNLLKKKSSQ